MSLLTRSLTRATVESAEPAAGRIRRISLTCPAPLDWTPGQQIRVQVAGVPGPRRTYSVWDHHGRTLELRVLDHGGDAPGARWARTALAGQTVRFSGPEGGFVPRPGPHHLFVGDETASAAFGPMMRALRAEGADVRAVVEIGSEAERLPLPGEVSWVLRHAASAAFSSALVAAVRERELPAGPGVAYVAGEARTVQAVRRHLVSERGWPRRSVVTKPFWTPGRKGMD